MKQYLLLIFCSLSLHLAFGQDLIFSHDTLSMAGDPSEFEVIGHAYVVNNSRSDVELKWVREEINFESSWQSAVCDNNTCYAASVSSNINPGSAPNVPVVLSPGDTSILDVHLYPFGSRGEGAVEVCVSYVDDPDNFVHCTYYHFNLNTSSSREIGQRDFNVFPNPTLDYFVVQDAEGLGSIQLYNTLGRRVRTFNVELNRKYYVGDLPSGMYLASLLDRKGKLIKTIRIAKRTLRP